MTPILLDTHVAVWSANGSLSLKIIKTLDACAERGELLLSPITAWEIGMLVKKHRLMLATTVEEYVRALFTRAGAVTADLTPSIAAASTLLPETLQQDPADRILVATAATYGARLATRDLRIQRFANATKYIRCIAC